MWNTIESAPSGRLVMTKIDDANGARNEQPLSRNGNLWFSGEMYVYYRPTHWRELTEIEKLRNAESDSNSLDTTETKE